MDMSIVGSLCIDGGITINKEQLKILSDAEQVFDIEFIDDTLEHNKKISFTPKKYNNLRYIIEPRKMKPFLANLIDSWSIVIDGDKTSILCIVKTDTIYSVLKKIFGKESYSN